MPSLHAPIARSAPVALAALVTLLALAGCAGPGGVSLAPVPDAGRDRVTASDQTDADRRAKTRLDLASAYFAQGQTETALDEVKQALLAKPDLPEAYNLRALIYAQLGDERLAEDSFRRALALNPKNGDTLHNYGWYLCQRRLFPEAAVQFRQALAVPQYVAAVRTHLALGVCQARAGQWVEAEQSLMRSYELDPGNPVTAINLAEVLMRRGEFDRARFYVRRVNSVNEFASAQTLWLAARIEKKMGNNVQVQEYGEQLRKRFPRAPETALFEGGRFDE